MNPYRTSTRGPKTKPRARTRSVFPTDEHVAWFYTIGFAAFLGWAAAMVIDYFWRLR